ncbi:MULTISPECIES: SigE family RNA polymerase sigma factor [Kitasatospora]|uniref:Putative RNA polymerase ECF subfamily sigma factor n=1 Tax=Kitasatospora setae (strain ATCC 33774 / DSM 43861 / JCM 3304 / KCC A-0304 / NBRC 14216 / KM-6054) TaxID=452652 RepID=E4NE69_KITSK|nr:SigE family RNA polymerase sigma factor [Kitasatospora setae]BAJ29500.1 putative RNA polymerase ECF subfamily sigma factor [Kitasatospora setae KM-6054]
MSRETEDDAYAAFVEEAWPRHLRTATLIAGNRDLGEELLQDCLVKLYVRWQRVSVDDPHAYLRRMLVNGNISRWRRFRRETLTAEIPEPASGHSGPADDDTADALHRALRALPLKQRAVVVLRYVEDLTEKDTAAVLGCSVGTVKSHHARAMTRLRTVLSGTWWKHQEVAAR